MIEKRIRILMTLSSVIFFSEALQIVSGKIVWIRYFEYIVILMLAGFAIKDALKYRITYYWVMLTIFMLAFFSARGLLLTNELKYFGMDIIAFAPFFLLFAIRGENEEKSFLNVYPKHICIWIGVGLFVALYLIVKYGLSSAYGDARFVTSDEMAFEREFGIGAVGRMLQPAVFVSPFYDRMSRNRKYLWVFGILSYIIMSLWTSSREGFIVGMFSIFIAFFSIRGIARIQLMMSSVIIAIILLGLWSYHSGSSAISEAIAVFTDRLQGQPEVIDGRILEATELLNQFDRTEWMIGRGLGGTQNVWIWYYSEAPMGGMHFGWGYLMLKGGLVWLVVVYGIMVWCFIALWMKKGWYRSLAMFLCLYLIQDMWLHHQWGNVTRTITAMSLAGTAFIHTKPRDTK